VAEIGLFPLGVVLLPGERLPLHIFEERYKELIGECLATGDEFGLVFADDAGVRAVGTRAAVAEVLRRLPDGRLDIVVEGRDRFRVREVTAGRSFVTAGVEPYSDEAGTESDPQALAACAAAFRRVSRAAGVNPPAELTEMDAFGLAGSIDLAPEAKQELLEMRSGRDRVTRLTELLEAAVEAVRLRRLIRERAAGNGHVPEEE
jgi:Lon protease-like protein